MRSINEYFLSLPDEVRKGSIYQFASSLPEGMETAAHNLHRRYTPSLLSKRKKIDPSVIPEKKVIDLVEQIKGFEAAPNSPEALLTSADKMDALVIKRTVRAKRGSWIQVAREHRADPSRSQDI